MKDLLQKLKELKIPNYEYAIYGSGPLAIRGIRKAKDLDLFVKEKTYKKLLKKYKEIQPGHIKIGKIEIFSIKNSYVDNPIYVINKADTIKGFKFIRLTDLIKFKKKLGRKKDYKDIELIKNI